MRENTREILRLQGEEMKPYCLFIIILLLSGCRWENLTHNTPEYYVGEGKIIEVTKPINKEVHAVPEPMTMALLGSGVVGAYFIKKRK